MHRSFVKEGWGHSVALSARTPHERKLASLLSELDCVFAELSGANKEHKHPACEQRVRFEYGEGLSKS